jgi:hypothetical protein
MGRAELAYGSLDRLLAGEPIAVEGDSPPKVFTFSL